SSVTSPGFKGSWQIRRMKFEACSNAVGLSSESQQAEINPYITENTIIVLLALLSALICFLGFHSIFPWDYFYGLHEGQTSARLANTGLKKKSIKALPSMVYSKVRSDPNIVAECPVCLVEYVGGEILRVLPKCGHSFHMECVDKWLLSHSSCPTCRQSSSERSSCGGHIRGEEGG
ncbi:hypothetical protein KI387_024954, partial [Taxus chinensis]